MQMNSAPHCGHGFSAGGLARESARVPYCDRRRFSRLGRIVADAVAFEQRSIAKRTHMVRGVSLNGLHAGWSRCRRKRKLQDVSWQAVAPPQSITPLKLVAPDDAGGGHPDDYEGRDNTKIRILLADSGTIYRVGIQKIFALEDDIRVVARVDTLAGLHDAIQRFPTDLVLLEGRLILGAVDTISELVRQVPKLKIIVQLSKNDQINTVELYSPGGSRDHPSFHLSRPAGQMRTQDRRRRNLDRQRVYQFGNRGLPIPEGCANQPANPAPFITQGAGCHHFVTQGMRNKEIASQLGTSEQVIKNYLRKIYDKLGVSDRLELALYWLNLQVPNKGP